MENKRFKKILAFKSLFFNILWDRDKAAYDGVRNWVRQNPFAYDFILSPLHIAPKTTGAASYWGLLVARLNHKDMTIFNSLWFAYNTRLKELAFFSQTEPLRRKRQPEV